MWSKAVTVLALLSGCRGFVLHSFSVPSTATPGSTVYLEASYELSAGEHIERLRWTKDNVPIVTFSEQPDTTTWGDYSGITVDKAGSQPSRIVLQNVGDSASGQYTLALLVSGQDGNVASFINSNSMIVGGAGDLGNRFGGSAAAGGGGGTSFQSSSASSSSQSGSGGTFQSATVGGATVGGGSGGQASFQSSPTGTFFGSAFGAGFPFDQTVFGPALDTRGTFGGAGAAAGGPNSLDAALQQAQENIQRAQAQLNVIQQALNQLAGGY